ncbi:hypothetical protein [Pontibacillus marinus]|uniref:Uncharacterized protein n=1 Tax=Pontibacillus marinus BH030004 = DSM 16465 TaxID=1385511 RepID=A0A0A5G7Q2_9BACI|nr:hypothetical protein [Pontibacillus marinus]KGX87130.1 hypothetical protein N783_10240 [Pontibacillus marinus BH030004 = DSM 16465]
MFKQRKFLSLRQYELQKDGVKVKAKGITNNHEYKINFETLGRDIEYYKNGSLGWLIGAIITTIVPLGVLIEDFFLGTEEASFGAGFFYLSISFICFTVYFSKAKNYLIITGGSHNLAFFKNKPSSYDLSEYIEDILLARKDYLRDKYTKIDIGYSFEDQVNIYRRLREEKIITEQEYENLVKVRIDYEEQPKEKAGFI